MEQSNSKRKKITGSWCQYVNTFGEKFDSMHTNFISLEAAQLSDVIKVSEKKYVSTVLTFGSMFDHSRNGVEYVVSFHTLLMPIYFVTQVCLHDGRRFDVRPFDYDVHYNIALLKIESTQSVSPAILKDVKVIGKAGARGGLLCQQSETFHLSHGDEVISVGRFFQEPYKAIYCPLMLKSTCKISKVIGINFYLEEYTPFMPINIVRKSNFCAELNLYMMEKITWKFPDISTGIVVKEVVSLSPAYHAGICPGDILLRCMETLSRFEAIILDKIGEALEMELVRKFKLVENTVVVEELRPDKFYSWCLPEKPWVQMGDA
ncbi:hypothetical protein MKW92_048564 [Papaver armeniacum]|nr:hypothetical protein MKW92_048564 [Papaver armeniacum]